MKPELSRRILGIGQRRRDLIKELRTKPSGLAWCETHTAICDEVVRTLYDDIMERFPGIPPFAILATGGYGRRELCPNSDIDVTVVPGEESSTEIDDVIRLLFQDLHWAFCTALRMDVGYSYRLISDAPGLDATSRTGLLDMRLLAGSPEVFHKLDEALQESFSAGEFILAKIVERDDQYQRHGDTPMVVEPHLKEGAGGLRDFHCGNWLREAIGERPTRSTLSYDTLLRYRNLLHVVTGKPQDLLSRARQAEIAEILETDPFEMMAAVSRAGIEVHRQYIRTKEKLHESRFSLATGVLAIQNEVRLLPNTDAGEAAVGIAIATRLGIGVSDLALQTSLSVRGPAAIFAVASGEKTLRNLDRCSVLAQMLPELEACRTLFPQDNVHTFSVFEHSLRVVRFLDSIEPNTFLGNLKSTLNDLEPLYLAALLHDIGKVDVEKKHSEVGEEMALAICQRWKLAPSVTEQVCWLIREHLSMARFIRIRDLMHPTTIDAFAEIVGDADRLTMLALLTWADINAVGPGAWTPAQETFLKQLYDRTLLRLQGELLPAPDAAQSRQRLLRQLKNQRADESKVQAFLESLPAYYLTSTPPDLINLHLNLAEKAAQGEITVEQYHRQDIGATELTICSPDAPGLLSQLLGVLYAFDLSVQAIRACTTSTEPPVALDVFTVSFNGRPVPPATSARTVKAILEVLHGETTLETVLHQRGKDPARQQQIFRHTFVPGQPGILEIRAPRGRGMPYRFSRLLTEQGWNILAARVGQWAGNAAAAFYITGRSGEPLTREEVDLAIAEKTATSSLALDVQSLLI